MESQCFSSKSTRCHYDITMSKRTRKPPYFEESINKNINTTTSIKEVIHVIGVVNIGGEKSSGSPRGGLDDEEEESDRKSLNQLMMNDGEATKVALADTNRGSKPHSPSHSLSLGDHFTDKEKPIQLITKQQGESSIVGLKSSRSGMLGRYIKVLSHLIKIKRDPCLVSRKKPILRLTT